jgi:tetrahedral aminopeptidase
MAIKDLLTELSEATGVSGHEEPVRRIVTREFEKYADEVKTTRLGSVIALKRATRGRAHSRNGRRAMPAPRLLLEGHMDEIGLIVTAIEQGFIHFTQVGGYDARILPSQNVVVHAREELPGVVAWRPPHVLSAAEREKTVPLNELLIDVGLPEARVRALVTVGDTITLDRKVVSLRNNFLAGKAFDDRAAVVALIDALRQLQDASLQWDVHVVANVQEEDGSWFAGATTSTFQIQPDVAVALDVSHADQPGIGEVNVVPLDKGPGIAMGPNIHPLVHERLVEVAQRYEIPHRVTAYAGATGTDAWAIQITAEGIPTGLLDLPLRYMHTPVETLAVSDLERTARLLAAFATSLDEEFHRAVRGPGTVQIARPGQASRRAVKKRQR